MKYLIQYNIYKMKEVNKIMIVLSAFRNHRWFQKYLIKSLMNKQLILKIWKRLVNLHLKMINDNYNH